MSSAFLFGFISFYLQSEINILIPSVISLIKKISEEVLVQELQAKKPSALEYLYDNYSGALYGVILRIVKSEEVAQEVLHDVYMKVWNNFSSYDAGKGRLYTWLANISRNASIDKIRSKEIKKTQKTDLVSDNVHTIDHANSQSQSIDGIGLDKVLDQLPDDLKFVIDLMYYKGYTQTEIAEEFNIPLGTVKTRARTAMRELRALLL